MNKPVRISVTLPAKPEAVYEAWLDSKKHSDFTGSPARIEGKVGGEYTAWDGYIRGTNLELIPGKRIVQSWRTTEFSSSSPDSKVIITFSESRSGTKLTLHHSNIPEGQEAEYQQGWKDFYFIPMS